MRRVRLRLLLRPGWLALTALVLVFAAVCFTLLSPWQFRRHEERSTTNNALAASANATPVDIDTVLSAGQAPGPGTEWRTVQVTGRYLAEDEVVARLRTVLGQAAFEVLTPFRLADTSVVLVDRGYVRPVQGDQAVAVPDFARPPGGTVTLTARLRADERDPRNRPPERRDGRLQVYAVGAGVVETRPVSTSGPVVAPLTPFTADLTVDDAGLKRQVDYVVKDCRATMVVAAGVETQEYTYLSFDQRRALIRRTIELVDGRVPVMVGISHPSFKTAISLAHEAEQLGAAAVQLLAPLRPFAGPPTQADLIAYYEAVGRETKLPITLYLNPGPGADVSIPDTIALAKLPCIQLDQGKLARSRAGVAADRRDRPCRPCALLHHHADAVRLADARRLRRHHAAAGIGDRAACDRCISGQGLRARRRDPIAVRAVPVEVDASRTGAGHEGGDEPDRRGDRRSLSALRAAVARGDRKRWRKS